jgi:hypothetical protein
LQVLILIHHILSSTLVLPSQVNHTSNLPPSFHHIHNQTHWIECLGLIVQFNIILFPHHCCRAKLLLVGLHNICGNNSEGLELGVGVSDDALELHNGNCTSTFELRVFELVFVKFFLGLYFLKFTPHHGHPLPFVSHQIVDQMFY